MSQGRINSDVCAWGGNILGFKRIPVIVNLAPPSSAREDARNVGGTLIEDRRDEDSRAEEKLSVYARKGRIVGEFPRQCSHNRAPGVVGKVEERVHVWQDTIPNTHRRPRRFCDTGPYIGFLRDRGQGVVVAIKGEESAKLHPTVTEFFIRIAVEAAGVDAEHGDAEEGKAKGLGDGEEHVGPKAGVVAAPVARPFAGAREGGPADDEGSFAGNGG